MTITEMRKRKLPPKFTKAQKSIYTPHGNVWLEASNWQAIADVLEKIKWSPNLDGVGQLVESKK